VSGCFVRATRQRGVENGQSAPLLRRRKVRRSRSMIDVCLFIDSNTHRYIVVYGTKAKAVTGASDAIKYKRK